MKIIFLDLHNTNFLVRPLKQIIYRNKIKSFKHKFLLDYAINRHMKVYDLILQKKYPAGPKGFFYRTFVREMAAVTLCLNGYKKNQISLLNVCDTIQDDDIVIAYSHNEEQLRYLEQLQCKKVVMGNHFIKIGKYSDLSALGVNAYVNEINIAHNEFINLYYTLDNVKPLVMPYAFSKRFRSIRPFQERKNLALAIGTLSSVEGVSGYEKYKEYAKTNWIQPMRKEILDKKDQLTDYIDSYISYIHEDKTYEIKKNDFFLIKLYKKYYNKSHEWRQSKYTSFDMVEKFNEYKIAICPEELVGVPGIGFVEGMACGCAYIGLDHVMYTDLGLIPGKHYITYDGSLTDLTAQIEYYQKHPDLLEAIARNGYEFVIEHFHPEKIAEDFYKAISQL